MASLVLVRHGQSTYNAKNIFTGWEDAPLTEKGIEEARQAGKLLKRISFDVVYVSDLIRARQTLDEIIKILGVQVPLTVAPEIKERNYGDFTHKNKEQVKDELGEEKFKKLRRGFDFPIANGESLRDVYNRSIHYFEQEILPKLIEGKNVLIVAHGNSLRALTKYLENISNEDIENLEIPTGQVILYQIDPSGKIASKEIRTAKT